MPVVQRIIQQLHGNYTLRRCVQSFKARSNKCIKVGDTILSNYCKIFIENKHLDGERRGNSSKSSTQREQTTTTYTSSFLGRAKSRIGSNYFKTRTKKVAKSIFEQIQFENKIID